MKFISRLLLAIVLLVGSSCVFATNRKGFSDIQDRHLSGFHAIDAAGSCDVYITQGSAESVKVEAPSDVIDRIKTEVDNGVLRIYIKHDTFNWGDLFGHKKIAVYVVARDLNNVSLSGSGDAFFRDGIRAGSLQLHISGSGDMTGKVEAKELESSISGSGDMSLSGHAGISNVRLVGSGDYNARGLFTQNTSVDVTGSGDADINVSNNLNAAVHGSGDVHYTGSPKHVYTNKTGSGDIGGN